MDKGTQNDDKAYIKFVGEERWATFGIFNGNAFPPGLEGIVSDCSSRAAMFLYHVNALNMNMTASKRMFIRQLKSNLSEQWTQGFVNTKINRDMNFMAIYDGLDYLAAFNCMLQELKSLLDIYANLMAKLIIPSAQLKFSKAIIEGINISGGKVVLWLRNSAPTNFANTSLLSEVIVKHSTDWITQAVKYRDTLIHYGDIKGLKHMHVMLKREYPPFNEAEIELPAMPDGRLLTDYCIGLVDKLANFLDESLKLLPNVDHSLIRFGSFVLPKTKTASRNI
ncbi:MAG: hypothetical protein JXC36_03455 [Candidatus Atribacteria bacterium]|nr:hypothetical protein [Candidatus Atribacteria bacterium]